MCKPSPLGHVAVTTQPSGQTDPSSYVPFVPSLSRLPFRLASVCLFKQLGIINLWSSPWLCQSQQEGNQARAEVSGEDWRPALCFGGQRAERWAHLCHQLHVSPGTLSPGLNQVKQRFQPPHCPNLKPIHITRIHQGAPPSPPPPPPSHSAPFHPLSPSYNSLASNLSVFQLPLISG